MFTRYTNFIKFYFSPKYFILIVGYYFTAVELCHGKNNIMSQPILKICCVKTNNSKIIKMQLKVHIVLLSWWRYVKYNINIINAYNSNVQMTKIIRKEPYIPKIQLYNFILWLGVLWSQTCSVVKYQPVSLVPWWVTTRVLVTSLVHKCSNQPYPLPKVKASTK